MPVFLDVTKLADFGYKKANVNRTHGVCYVIPIFFGSTSGNI